MRIAIFCLSVIVCLHAVAASAAEQHDAKQLLESFRTTVERMNGFRVEATLKKWSNRNATADEKEQLERTRQYTVFHRDYRWRVGMVQRPSALNAARSELTSGVEYLFDEFGSDKQSVHVQWASRVPDDPPKLDHLSLMLMGRTHDEELPRYLAGLAAAFGYSDVDDGQPLWKVMQEAATLKVSPQMEPVADHQTLVVTSQGRFGTHTLWLDPEFGFLPRRIVIQKRPGDLLDKVQLGVEQSPASGIAPRVAPGLQRQPNFTVQECRDSFERIHLENKQGNFVITAFDHVQEKTVKYADRTERMQQRAEYRTQQFDFEPDHWPAKPFRPGFTIPDGTPVASRENPQQRFVWKNGKIE